MQLLPLDARIEAQLERYRHNLPHAMLISGEEGMGLRAVAQGLHANIEHIILPEHLKSASSRETISIETIRNLQIATRGRSAKSVGVLIDNADRMTVPAQQAFLKLLEEPPQSIVFLLTSHQPESLLPTIRSRLVEVYIPLVSYDASERYLHEQGIDAVTSQQLLFVASGRSAELHRLVQDKEYRDKVIQRVKQARLFLEASPYEQGCIVMRISDRGEAMELLDTTLTILDFLTKRSPSNTELIKKTDQALNIRQLLEQNVNPRLQLLSLVL